jgi:hypothetical protein
VWKWRSSIAAARGTVSSPPDRESLSTPPWDSESPALAGEWIASDGSSKPFQSTYYDARMRASPALLRARAPYLVKNTITGFAICSLVIGICTLDWTRY